MNDLSVKLRNLVRLAYDWLVFQPRRAARNLRRQKQLERAETISEQKLLRLFSLLAPVSVGEELTRVGPQSDGGYVLPSSCFEVIRVLSPGVDVNSEFELEFAERGIVCHLIDASVASPKQSHSNFRFRPLFLGDKTGSNVITLSDWLALEGLETASNLGMQMDIEGAEWSVIKNVDSATLEKFEWLTIEFHSLDRALLVESHEKFLGALKKLSVTHAPVWIHANNFGCSFKLHGYKVPETMEVSFVRKGGKNLHPSKSIVSSLSSPNNPRLTELDLDPRLFGLTN